MYPRHLTTLYASHPEVRVLFPALPDFLRNIGSGTGSTQHRECNWGLLGRKCSGSGLESLENGCRDPSRWPRGTVYPQKLALTSPTSDGLSVGIVLSRTQATEFSFFSLVHDSSLRMVGAQRFEPSQSFLEFAQLWFHDQLLDIPVPYTTEDRESMRQLIPLRWDSPCKFRNCFLKQLELWSLRSPDFSLFYENEPT
jgi:hypothetical protein